MNKLCEYDIEFKYSKHLTMATCSHTVYRDERFKIQKENITKRDGHGWVGSTKTYYFIDDCPKEFTKISDLVDEWNSKLDYDEETTEVRWIKVIKNKSTEN